MENINVMRQTHSWIPRPLYWFSESLLSNCSFDKLNWYQTNNVGVHLLVDICQVWSYLRLWSYLSRFHIQAIQLVFLFKKISVFVTFISPPNFLFLIVDGRPMYVELDLPVWYLLMISPPKMKSVHMFKRSTDFFFYTSISNQFSYLAPTANQGVTMCSFPFLCRLCKRSWK